MSQNPLVLIIIIKLRLFEVLIVCSKRSKLFIVVKLKGFYFVYEELLSISEIPLYIFRALHETLMGFIGVAYVVIAVFIEVALVLNCKVVAFSKAPGAGARKNLLLLIFAPMFSLLRERKQEAVACTLDELSIGLKLQIREASEQLTVSSPNDDDNFWGCKLLF